MMTFMTPLLVLDYEIRKDYIAEYLCVNKDRVNTVTVCAGKCYVTKNILLFEEESSEAETNFPPGISFNLFQDKLSGFQIEANHKSETDLSFKPYLISYSFSFQEAVNKPPSLV